MKNFCLLRKSIAFRILLLSTVFISFSNNTPQYDSFYNPRVANEVLDTSTCYDTTDQEEKPSLFAFIVGATPPDIQWTIKDANDMEKALLRQKDISSGLYENVVTETVVGQTATATGIEKRLKSFIQLNEIKPIDVFIFYVSSHGYRDGKKFWLQASDYSKITPEKTSLLLNDLIDIFDGTYKIPDGSKPRKVAGKKLLFIDACESGRGRIPPPFKAGIKAGNLHNAIKEITTAKPDYTIITSSVGDSYYFKQWENSAFTEAFLKGLEGEADLDRNNYITTGEIYNYLNRKVPLLCKELLIKDVQRPDILKFKVDIPFFALNTKSEDYKEPLAEHVPLSHEESGLTTYTGYEMDFKPKTKLEEEQKWEQYPITLFRGYDNGEPYLEGRIIFMGTEKKMGLRIEIAILGEATAYFGRDLPRIVVNIEGTKKKYITSDFSYMYMCNYDPVRNKTFYVTAYDFTQKDKKLLESRKVTSVDVGWASGRKRYEVTTPNAFIRQLDNIQRAEDDGIIERLKLQKN